MTLREGESGDRVSIFNSLRGEKHKHHSTKQEEGQEEGKPKLILSSNPNSFLSHSGAAILQNPHAGEGGTDHCPALTIALTVPGEL